MFTAHQARQLKDAMQKQYVEVEIYKILRDVVERASDPKDRNYVYADLDFTGEKVDFIVNRLIGLGFSVQAEQDVAEKYSSITVRW